jgi:uncharacterized protein (DUF305 family)
MIRTVFTTASLTAALMLGGFALAQHHHHGSPPTGTTGASSAPAPSMAQMMAEMQPSPNDTPFLRAFKEAHIKMMHDMHFKLSGDPDTDFVKGMVPHHQGAIDMAKVQLAHGKDPELRKLAEAIIRDQEREIAQMNAWLKGRGK